MISVLLTAYKEPNTIGKAIESFQKQLSKNDEILVAAPDEETKKVILSYSKKDKRVKYVGDSAKGKPIALNILFNKAKGGILILSDGDVHVSYNAVTELLLPFRDTKIGAVTGRPISVNHRENMLGYWSHLLTDIGAHETRLNLVKKGKFIVCSGYLFAMRKGIFKKVPEDALSDDAVISHFIWAKSFKIGYAPKALVYVKYPTTFSDWLKQKKRSAGGYWQIKQYVKNTPTMRSFSKETTGFFRIWKYPKTVKEIYWTGILVFARLYLWARILLNQKVRKASFKQTWQRVESTK